MATRMQQRRGTAAQWTAANPVLAEGEIGFEIDTDQFKIGDGDTQWDDLSYFQSSVALGGTFDDYVPLDSVGEANGVASLDGNGKIPVAQLGNVIDGAGSALDTLNELAAALNDDANFSTTITTAISNRAKAVAKTASQWASDTSETPAGQVSVETDTGKVKITTVTGATYAETDYVVSLDELNSTITALDIAQISSDLSTAEGAITTLQGEVSDLATNLSNNEQGVADLVTDLGAVTSRVSDLETFESSTTSALSDIDTDLNLKAPKANPEFTGNVSLPSTTTIGSVSSTEIGYLTGTTSSVQTQLDAKLASATASSTYAPLNAPTFTGTVVLPNTTSIGTVDATELAYVNGVTSAIQTQLDAKAPTANPTFTGTVAGVTKSHVGLGNVDNTSDANKPVSDDTQDALDLKADLAGATFTGDVTVETDLVVEGNLTVSGTTTTIDVTDLSVSDPLIYLASGQYAEDVLDVGFLAATGVVGGTEGSHLHSGFFRDVSDSKKWKLVSNVPHPVSNVVDTTNATRETLVVGNLEATGVVFSDGTQTKQGVPSITTIAAKTDSYTLSNLNERDTIVEIGKSSATTLTVPANSSVAYPVGTTIDIIQTGTGQVTIAGAGGVTVNATPGLKLRTQWSSATLLKRAENTWLVYGDLTA